MDNFTNIYDDSWTELAKPVTKAELTEGDNESEKESQTEPKQGKGANKNRHLTTPIITIQLVLCLIVLTFLFLCKTFSIDLYREIKAFYDKEISANLISSGDFSSHDYSELFASSDDEI